MPRAEAPGAAGATQACDAAMEELAEEQALLQALSEEEPDKDARDEDDASEAAGSPPERSSLLPGSAAARGSAPRPPWL